MSRLQIRRYSDADDLTARLCANNTYIHHQELWRLFGTDPDADRDFLFRRNLDQGSPVFYLLSQRMPEDPSGIWNIQTKPFKPALQTGQRLAFSIRANPTISRRDARGRSRRHDLVMDLKKQSNWQSSKADDRTPAHQLHQTAASTWLAPRLEANGAKLESCMAEHYETHRDHKPRGTKPIQFSSLDISGTLEVKDPERFQSALKNGVGPAKSLGCGLLLVRRL